MHGTPQRDDTSISPAISFNYGWGVKTSPSSINKGALPISEGAQGEAERERGSEGW